jgi:hypothetical protein
MGSSKLLQVQHLRCMFFVVMALLISGCSQSENDTAKRTTKTAISEHYPLLDWSQLTPANWDANSLLKDIDLSKMEDNDPRAFELLKEVREQWNNAPVVTSLDGKAITINGYVAPLDGDAEHVKEFLLVPYFGACIHSPPPPSNQVIHVHIAGQGIPLINWDSFVTVSGTLKVAQSNSGIGVAGYQMQADIVKPLVDVVP